MVVQPFCLKSDISSLNLGVLPLYEVLQPMDLVSRDSSWLTSRCNSPGHVAPCHNYPCNLNGQKPAKICCCFGTNLNWIFYYEYLFCRPVLGLIVKLQCCVLACRNLLCY